MGGESTDEEDKVVNQADDLPPVDKDFIDMTYYGQKLSEKEYSAKYRIQYVEDFEP